MEILKLAPFFSERLWGGQKLKEMGFKTPINKKIGEAWVISAHENGMSYIDSPGTYEGMALKDLFEKHHELFGGNYKEYPLLVKVITARDYLSVQVHPDDEYAKEHHNSFGKPESWYVLEAPKDSELIYGHNAKTADEFKKMVDEGNWDKLLKKEPIEEGDFLYVPPGKVHAITPEVVIYELQRSSDITYRLYDYDRLDDKGNPRELHIQESLDNTKIPDTDHFVTKKAKGKVFSSEFFSLEIVEGAHQKEYICPEPADWLQITAIKGSGTINGVKFSKAQSAITIKGIDKMTITGNLKFLVSWIKK
ncbi:type I phosphomannose isomerase catalytic subunit [Spiroplasma alleghenense]|uniref:Mannose-6-phosphate isomerase n=1 Tax=Spiroplasma alleghenense TaxID=216931 RepID=A0A345Z2E5_9MOLU|nr:type I phosphomannose isomerase catalytic subunit [Spiroplasma alleghenense]AXK50774.1 mannose-6-phosphate isomerase [Spiroplasma alleghenense]